MEIARIIFNQIKHHWFSFVGVTVAMIAIVMGMMIGGMSVGLAIAAIPVLLIFIAIIIKNPYWGLLALFILNYFIIALIRYTNIEGLSVFTDILIVFTMFCMILQSLFYSRYDFSKLNNNLLFASLVWMAFCVVEIFNPSAMVKAWFLSRGQVYYFPMIIVLTTILFNRFRDVKVMLYVLSVLTIIGIAKGLSQKTFGFDSAEAAFLNAGAYKTHLLATGTRYFSIYASAGIFGAIMGYSMVVFGIAAIYMKKWSVRIYFILVSLGSLYAMMISGTRGAIAVPLAGFALFVLLSKKIRIIIPSAAMLIVAYVFLAHTTIGQSNEYIRRMRTAFDPNEASLVVRKENQKLLGQYLADKPFGEGLGLSGVEAQDISSRFTTSIPTDSWYVKIWVETGIVGLLLYIAMFVYIIAYGSYILFFKIKDDTVRGLLSALLCGVFGILVSSYGNQVFGQFPVAIIMYMSMAFVFMARDFDKQAAGQKT